MSHSTKAVLVVEDDADDQYFISRAFKEAASDTQLDAVSDGQSAIEFLGYVPPGQVVPQHRPPNIVLLDLNLPRKSGLEVLKWIRGNAALNSTVVIVLTSSTSEDDMREAYARGANAYVIKPVDPTRLGELARLVKEFWFTWNQFPPLRN
jgi:CheY-like chemotaxis protein